MIDLWTLPKAERNSIENRLKQLQESVNRRRDELQRCQNQLDLLNQQQVKDVEKIRKLLETYKIKG